MTTTAQPVTATEYGGREYYSPGAHPHYVWFDDPGQEQAFRASSRFADEQWRINELWCCCACIADLPVAVPMGHELLKNLHDGDPVLAGTVRHGDGGPELQWEQTTVALSGPAGMDPARTTTVLINYAGGRNAIVETDQPVLTADGTLKRANQLRLDDGLLGTDGTRSEINALKLGTFEGPKYHLGTAAEYTGSADRHLIALGDLVIGDYAVYRNWTG